MTSFEDIECLRHCFLQNWWNCASGVCPTRTKCESAFLWIFCGTYRKMYGKSVLRTGSLDFPNVICF